jgi:16S rRNA (guanine966-N2)-methyltransferase
MRIISGKAKGRRLKVPNLPGGKKIRPLSEQAREALFNILSADVVDSRFLDLFAGTGAVGIEALSRGAKIAFFVELDRKTVGAIRENLEMCGFSEISEVYSLDAIRAIGVLDSKGASFDIIFMGPPYGSPNLEKALETISASNIVATGGTVIAERMVKHELPESFGDLKRRRECRYGDTVLSFYKKETVK